MTTFCKTALTVAALAIIASPALAQRQGRGNFGFGGGQTGAAQLLANKSVQEELKLTTDEVEKVSAPGKKLREKQRSLFTDLGKDATMEKRQEKMKELTELAKTVNEEATKIAKDTLSSDKFKRFEQISIQVKGYAAFEEEPVQTKLNITDSEKSDIKKITEEAATKMKELQPARGGFGKGQGQGQAKGNQEETQTKIKALRKETLEKCVAVLNDAQKAEWKEMTGSPFEYKPDTFMRGN
jgi:hypothetical protein